MNNLKKLIFGLAALVLAFGLVFSVLAFIPAKKKIATLTYRYNGPGEAGLTDPLNWSDLSEEEEPEGCEVGDELPCLVQFNDTEYDDIADFYTTHSTAPSMFASQKVLTRKDESQ